jgi:predicted Rossmann-fold nucleotide-binding protein
MGPQGGDGRPCRRLPGPAGGFGTLEELLEVITFRQLRLHDRPVVLLSVAGYYDLFLAMVRSMVEQGFAPVGEGALFRVARAPAEAVDLAEMGPGPVPAGGPLVEALAEDWTDASPAP